MTPLWIPFMFLLLFIVHLRRRGRALNPHRRLPPGPPPLPFIGNLHQLLGDLPHITLRKLSHKYGPLIHLKLGQVPTIIASSPETAAEILKAQDVVFCSRPFFATTDRFSYGGLDIAFSPYNDHWRRIRRFVNAEIFSPARVQDFKAVREEEVGALLKTISMVSAGGNGFNLSTMMLCLFNNLIYRKVFGKRISAVPGDCGRSQHHEMIMEVVAFTSEICVGDFFPSLAWLDGLTSWRGRLEKAFRAMDRVFEQEIEEGMKRRRGREEEKSSMGEDINADSCLLDILLKCQEEMDSSLGFLLTRDMIKAVLMDMFLAGTNPAAITLEWAMAELIKNPKSMRKAQEEVRRVAKDKGKVEDADLQYLPYLHNVVKETLRLHPPGPLLLPHECIIDTKINGYDILTKTRVFINAWAIGRDAKVWSEEPEAFRPERFEKMRDGVDFKGHHFEFIPFGAGRRICPGMMLGVVAVELALANVLNGFDWELPCGMRCEEMDLSEGFRMVSHKKVPLTVVAIPAAGFT
ncbi:cytochrome P450 71A1-like [Dendrobium catenatum]|uniref:Cytochrome P450 71A1 n=1 Tax=Dendrobium catenatum TaxID=906689 RepID=A0A2I0X1A5_9ASPA|nr:cytochrome P450 71A1-like [Dendrobium catenatum]PKU81695.1 Cytochrome P450 71A1 [Dendrobium catenatum]